MIDITGFVFLALVGFCLFLDWLFGDLIWDRDTLTLTTKKIQKENSPAGTGERLKKNSQGYYIISWGDLKDEKN